MWEELCFAYTEKNTAQQEPRRTNYLQTCFPLSVKDNKAIFHICEQTISCLADVDFNYPFTRVFVIFNYVSAL